MTGTVGSARGTLLVVATPIGNLDDISPRVQEALAAATLVAAEDTRRSRQLLAHLGLAKPLVACHRFSEARTLSRLLDELAGGGTVALVTDGGTPAISDPGHRLVAAAHEAGHRVIPIAGPSALAAALSAAGFPADRFLFAGFLPARRAARRAEIERLARHAETLVLYEAPHRALECIADLAEILGPRRAALCRELTKLHEEIAVATLPELQARLAARDKVLGEIVLVIEAGRGTPAGVEAGGGERELALLYRLALEVEDGDARRAMRRLARDLDTTRQKLRRRLEAAGLG